MGHPRCRAGRAIWRTTGGTVVVLALASGCSTGTPPDVPRSPGSDSAALRVETVAGADRLDESTRAELEGAVGDVLSTYVVEAFLGDFPRQEFVQSFESFTSEAARDAAGDIDRLTAAAVPGATAMRATELDARLSFLTQSRTVHGVSANVHFAFEATTDTGILQPLTLDGRFMLVLERGTWSVFGYDLRFDDGDGVPVETESDAPSDAGGAS